MNSDQIKDNQITTNKLIITVIYIKIIAGLTVYALINFVNLNTVLLKVFNVYFFPSYAVNIVISLIVVKIGLDKNVSRYILFAELIISFFVSFLIFGIYFSLFLIIPVIVSSRALNRKETFATGLCSWFSAVLAIGLNLLLNQTSELMRALHNYQEIFIWDYPNDVFTYYFVPITFEFIMILIVLDNIIANGKKQIDREIKMSSELAAAAMIQENTLPDKCFDSPDGNISIVAEQKPAKEMSGDFFDYIVIDDKHVAFLVADVTDKGVPAALFMMAAQKAIRICLQENSDLSKAIFSANNRLCQNNSSNMFLTMWIGVIDIENRTVEFVNCGHPMPVIVDSEGNARFVENVPNLFVGCFENAEFPVNRISFNKGDKLIIYTDGITDIRNKEDNSFGTDRLLGLAEKGICKPKDIISKCLEFSGKTTQFDDMTVMEICFN